MKTTKKIVITGGGVISPLGLGLKPFWDGLKENQSGISVKSNWGIPDLVENLSIFYGSCADFKIENFISNLKPPFPLRYSQLAMMGCLMAIEDAELDLSAITPERIGLILDTTYSANEAAETFLYKLFIDGPAKVSPFTFTKTTTNCALGDVARAFKLRGPSSILLGENSVAYGYDLIQDGKADIVICGGFDDVREISFLANAYRGYYSSAKKNDKLMTFEEYLQSEEGVIIQGEGSGFVVLESAEHAEKRQAKIYAEMVDYHITGDFAYNDFIYERSADALQDNISTLLEQNSIAVSEVGLFVGGAGLPWHIREYEAISLKKLWENDTLHYTNVKGKIGETMSASANISLMVGALSLKENIVLGTGFDERQSGFDNSNIIAPTNTVANVLDKKYAIVNGLHVGGNTSNILLRKY